MLKVAFLAIPLVAGCAITPAQMYFGQQPLYYAAAHSNPGYNPGYSTRKCPNCKTYSQMAAERDANSADYGPTGALCSNTHENPNYCVHRANEGTANNVYPGMLPEGGRAVSTGNGNWWVHW